MQVIQTEELICEDSTLEAAVALLLSIPSMATGFAITTAHGEIAVSGEDAMAVMDVLSRRLKSRMRMHLAQDSYESTAIHVNSLDDGDVLRILAYYNNQARESKEIESEVTSNEYLRKTSRVLEMRGIIPMTLIADNLTFGVVYPAPEVNLENTSIRFQA